MYLFKTEISNSLMIHNLQHKRTQAERANLCKTKEFHHTHSN